MGVSFLQRWCLGSGFVPCFFYLYVLAIILYCTTLPILYSENKRERECIVFEGTAPKYTLEPCMINLTGGERLWLSGSPSKGRRLRHSSMADREAQFDACPAVLEEHISNG